MQIAEFKSKVESGAIRVHMGDLARTMQEYVNPQRQRAFFEKLVSKESLNIKWRDILLPRMPRVIRPKAPGQGPLLVKSTSNAGSVVGSGGGGSGDGHASSDGGAGAGSDSGSGSGPLASPSAMDSGPAAGAAGGSGGSAAGSSGAGGFSGSSSTVSGPGGTLYLASSASASRTSGSGSSAGGSSGGGSSGAGSGSGGGGGFGPSNGGPGMHFQQQLQGQFYMQHAVTAPAGGFAFPLAAVATGSITGSSSQRTGRPMQLRATGARHQFDVDASTGRSGSAGIGAGGSIVGESVNIDAGEVDAADALGVMAVASAPSMGMSMAADGDGYSGHGGGDQHYDDGAAGDGDDDSDGDGDGGHGNHYVDDEGEPADEADDAALLQAVAARQSPSAAAGKLHASLPAPVAMAARHAQAPAVVGNSGVNVAAAEAAVAFGAGANSAAAGQGNAIETACGTAPKSNIWPAGGLPAQAAAAPA